MYDANITDENINQGYRNREDIRRIDIVETQDSLIAKAYYADKSLVKDFKGYWYGWQIIQGRGVVWTSLGHQRSSISKPSASKFTEIQVYKYGGVDENVPASNTRAVWIPSK